MSIKVRAKERGFFNNSLVEPGQEFEVEKKEQLGKWMEVISAAKPKAPEKETKGEDGKKGDDGK